MTERIADDGARKTGWQQLLAFGSEGANASLVVLLLGYGVVAVAITYSAASVVGLLLILAGRGTRQRCGLTYARNQVLSRSTGRGADGLWKRVDPGREHVRSGRAERSKAEIAAERAAHGHRRSRGDRGHECGVEPNGDAPGSVLDEADARRIDR